MHDKSNSSPERLATNSQKEAFEKSDGRLTKSLADEILRSHYFARDASGEIYHYESGRYLPKGDEAIRRHVKRLLVDSDEIRHWSPSLVEAVVKFITIDVRMLWDRPKVDLLCVQNGLLRLTDRQLLPHSPDHLSTVLVPVTYDPTATCPEIEKFVTDVFPADSLPLAWEIFAWAMCPDTSIQKAVLFLGPGGNGKSTFLSLLSSFLGRRNLSATSLHTLESDRFAVARLEGKLANICPDLPTSDLSGTSVFKSLTGGDVMVAERKFCPSFEFIPFAKLLFSANALPRSLDSSTGFFDRWVIVPFERTFRGVCGEVTRDQLNAMLSSPGELSGLLNKAISALPQLKSGRFSESPTLQRVAEEFRSLTDPVAVWLDRYTHDGHDCIVPRKTLRISYNAELERQGRPVIADKAFGQAFQRLRPNVITKQRTVNGKLEWCYVGIGLAAELYGASANATALEAASTAA